MAFAQISYDELQSAQALAVLDREGAFKLTGSPAVAKAVADQYALMRSNGYFGETGAKWCDLCDFNGIGDLQLPMLEVFADSKVVELSTAYLGSELCMSSTSISASIRTIDPAARIKGGVPFHQDRAVIGVERSLTFWYLVDPDLTSDRVPGLDLVTGHRKSLVRHAVLKTDAAPRHVTLAGPVQPADPTAEYYDMELTQEAHNHDSFHTPRIARGDVVVFDNYCPHRTAVGPSYQEERTSLDVRIWRFDTRIAGSLIRAGHGLVVLLRQDWLQPRRKLANDDSAQVFDHGDMDAYQGSTVRDRRVMARAFARAQLQAVGMLTGGEDAQSSPDLTLDQFAKLCVARFELALEDGHHASFISEATTARGARLEQSCLGDGFDPRSSLDIAAVVPLLAKAKDAGARFFGALFVGTPATASCAMAFYDLHRGQERRMAGTIVRDRVGNFLCIDHEREAA